MRLHAHADTRKLRIYFYRGSALRPRVSGSLSMGRHLKGDTVSSESKLQIDGSTNDSTTSIHRVRTSSTRLQLQTVEHRTLYRSRRLPSSSRKKGKQPEKYRGIVSCRARSRVTIGTGERERCPRCLEKGLGKSVINFARRSIIRGRDIIDQNVDRADWQAARNRRSGVARCTILITK